MQLYQINYDLRSKSPDHATVDEKIQTIFPGATRALASTWLTWHSGTALDVAEIMRLQVLDHDDGLIVTTAVGGFAWNIGQTNPNALGATRNGLAGPVPLHTLVTSALANWFAERLKSPSRR